MKLAEVLQQVTAEGFEVSFVRHENARATAVRLERRRPPQGFLQCVDDYALYESSYADALLAEIVMRLHSRALADVFAPLAIPGPAGEPAKPDTEFRAVGLSPFRHAISHFFGGEPSDEEVERAVAKVRQRAELKIVGQIAEDIYGDPAARQPGLVATNLTSQPVSLNGVTVHGVLGTVLSADEQDPGSVKVALPAINDPAGQPQPAAAPDPPGQTWRHRKPLL